MSTQLVHDAGEALEQLHAHGYVVLEDLVPAATVRDLRDRIEQLLQHERAHPPDPGDAPAIEHDDDIARHFADIWQLSDDEAERLLQTCRENLGLGIAGLMCIPPVEEEPGVHFAFLAKLARDLRLSALSMGVSADFEKAIALRATHVRIGSEIFGSRPA